MNKEKLINRLSKVKELIERGATEGEKQAARIQFKKIIQNNELTEDDLLDIIKKEYCFKYANYAEMCLFMHLYCNLKDIYSEENDSYVKSGASEQRKIYAKLTKLEYIELTAMYEYFRRHMKDQYKEAMLEVKSKYFAKFRNFKKLQPVLRTSQSVFINEYCNRSGIRSKTKRAPKSVETPLSATTIGNIEGGQYNKQLNTDSRMLEHSI